MHQHPYFNLLLVPTILGCLVLALLTVLLVLLIVDRLRRTDTAAPTPACTCGCQHLTAAQIRDLRAYIPVTVPAGDEQ